MVGGALDLGPLPAAGRRGPPGELRGRVVGVVAVVVVRVVVVVLALDEEAEALRGVVVGALDEDAPELGEGDEGEAAREREEEGGGGAVEEAPGPAVRAERARNPI